MGVDDLFPLILGRSIVVDSGDNGQQVFGKTDSWYGRGQHRHDIDHGQLGRRKSVLPSDDAQNHIDDADINEKDEERSRCIEIVGQQRPFDDHIGVGQGQTDEKGHERAD